jgi:AraC-like DNA-binding protein
VQAIGSHPVLEQQGPVIWQVPLIAVALGNGVLFWLFTAALFDDAFRWRRRHLLAWAAAALIGALQCPAALLLPPGPLLGALRGALRLVPLLCAAATLWTLLRTGRDDLVETRRRLRALLVGAGVAYALLQLGARLSTPQGRLTPELALLDVTGQLVLVGGWALLTLRLSTAKLLQPPAARDPARSRPAPDPTPAAAAALPASPATDPEGGGAEPAPAAARTDLVEEIEPLDTDLAHRLAAAMAEDRLHRRDDLSIATLARHLGVPEYRLRRHINQRLGFRNFSAFVNSHRLADARRWLADPDQRDTPVLTLALDAGFGSIGPYNRAFKAETGLTPTEFRQRALAES